MNIFLFLKPKSEVAFVYEDNTIRQVLEKMEFHRYTVIPIIDKDGRYVDSLSEGDLLWFIKKHTELNLKEAEEISIKEVHRHRNYLSMYAECEMEDLISKASDQNFVPIIDMEGIFIGIVTRKDIINYLYKENYKKIEIK